MKLNKLFMLPVLAVAMASCQKETAEDLLSPSADNTAARSAATNLNNNIGPVPGSFTQKLLMENLVGAPYGKCPEADYAIQLAQSQNPGRIIVTSFHKDDAMQTPATASLLNFVGNGTTPPIPAVMMNRVPYNNKLFNDDGTWPSNVNTALSSVTHCGLALQSAMIPYKLTVSVHVGFNASMTGNYKLCVYVVEDNVRGGGSGYDQVNSFNNLSGSPFYNLGNPIVNYVHNNVLRRTLTPLTGTAIPASYLVNGGHMIQSYQMDFPPTYHANSCSVVAYVYDTATLRIVNVQEGKVGVTQNWD